MDLTDVLNNINFVTRYQKICLDHNDFENRLSGNNRGLYDHVLSTFNYKSKYFPKEHFYRIVIEEGGYEFGLQLVLKDGLVEPMIDIRKDGTYFSPDGRFDFIPQEMGVEFDRKKYNLPKYTSEEELKSILKELFLIFEDIKSELAKA
ncbi:MAG TPA: hypothetical protein VGQ59_00500 [Cyclobacteriaceae bacterium]|jgi:hypothetical protein|nr:hypothetical protein [Cyclobacteriaceae bacterium]